MLKDLIVRLMEEANEESEHKGFCDAELATNGQTRKAKTEAVEMIKASIDELTASISEIGEDITELSTDIAESDKAVAESTELRNKEKAENEAAIADAQAAQTAVAQAMVVLKEFYAKSAEPAALLQLRQQPEIFESGGTVTQGAESGGVIGMLEVIESDYARVDSETSAAEAAAEKSYKDFMTTSQVDKASKTTALNHKSAKKQNKERALNAQNEDLQGNQKLLDAALEYFEKLKPSCVDSGADYEERVARRGDEIKSLQEGLKILNGEDIA